MNPVTAKLDSHVILYDAALLPAVQVQLFEPGWWEQQGLLAGTAPGRGTTCFIDMPFGPAVLRHYLRGGLAARFSQDRYWFAGVKRSRPFREFQLLQRMSGDGLRVPVPVAALCSRMGAGYRGALITRRIAPAQGLDTLVGTPDLDWRAVGAGLRAFHDAGVYHADLNARNILIGDADGSVWLLDFDRCRYQPGKPVDGRSNLARLNRSLLKFWPGGADNTGPGLAACWKQLLKGYQEST
jgi:3-deoxy-D-manno-octulosonic acid kinase